MLQIIGWLGCLYLAIKGFEIAGGTNFRDLDGKPTAAAKIAATIAWIGAFVFALLLLAQGNAFQQPEPSPSDELTQSQIDCINKTQADGGNVLACVGK